MSHFFYFEDQTKLWKNKMKKRLRTIYPISLLGQLRTTTILVSSPLSRVTKNKKISKYKKISRDEIATIGFLFTDDAPIPEVNELNLKQIRSEDPAVVTRHLTERTYNATMNGSLWFRPIVYYRAEEKDTLGRFGDVTESTFMQAINTDSGQYKELRTPNNGIVQNTAVFGHANQIVYEKFVNDYIACFSMGGFDPDRAQILCKKQAPDDEPLTHYIEFDLKLLKALLEKLMKDGDYVSPYQVSHLFGRKIMYENKDFQFWSLDPTGQEFLSGLDVWVNCVFVKPKWFEHEDEYRIVLFKNGAVGGVETSNEDPLKFDDLRIAQCIIPDGHGRI